MKAYLQLSDIESMEKAAAGQRDRLLIRLLSRLGCRISEALALKVEDIDFEQGTITILHLKRSMKISCPQCGVRLGNRHQFCPGCGVKVSERIRSQQERRRIRVLPIDEVTLAMLKSYINTLPSNHNESLLFRLNRHRAWQIVRDCAFVCPTGAIQIGSDGKPVLPKVKIPYPEIEAMMQREAIATS